ncbi:MAG: hypothetical protein WC725_05190 [Patescibacteria group bacterium]|jgi:hypothetical protein
MKNSSELNKMHACKKNAELLQEFYEFLIHKKKIYLARYETREEEKIVNVFTGTTKTYQYEELTLIPETALEKLFADFFEIDLNECEKEKRILLASCREEKVK